MREINFKFLAGVAVVASAVALSGCNSSRDGQLTAQTIAMAQPVVRPASKPTATPRPTLKPKGIAFFKIKTHKKVFALTFDDGPDPTYTPQILKILKQKKAPATFFMVGKMVRDHASTGRLVAQAGHSIGNHTWSHGRHPRDPRDEVERTDAVIQKNLGVASRLFRPPYGIRNNGLASAASARGEDVILWSSDSQDWNHHTSAARIHNNVMKNAKSGGIALMHDGGGNRSQTVAALPGLIDALRARGFKLVTVPELMKTGAPESARIGAVAARTSAKKVKLAQFVG